MKKNKMMRLASVLLVLCLLTTSVISGTFAKYITTDQQYDTARVAKFGVVASLSGDLFGATYVGATDNSITTYGVNDGTVSSSVNGEDFVVAPGTKNTDGLTLSVTGTPEVATKVIFDAAEDAENGAKNYVDSDIYLVDGVYAYMVPYDGELTKENITNYYYASGVNTVIYQKATADMWDDDGLIVYEAMGVVTVAEADGKYYPLLWSLDVDQHTTLNLTDVRTIAEVKTNLEKLFNTDTSTDTSDEPGIKFDPNETNALKAKVTWKWDYVDENSGAWADQYNDTNELTTNVDKMDTILGSMMAAYSGASDVKIVTADPTNSYYTAVSYNLESVTTTDGDVAANKVVVVRHPTTGAQLACLTAAFNARLTVEQVD